MKNIFKYLVLLFIGGFIYYNIEILYRGHSHWSMALLGGMLFIIIGSINEFIPDKMPVLFQGLLGSFIVTVFEFFAGLILNIWLELDIWDYSNIPLNVFGQICLPFSLAWVGLSLVAIFVDDFCRHKLFDEPMPKYIFWFNKEVK